MQWVYYCSSLRRLLAQTMNYRLLHPLLVEIKSLLGKLLPPQRYRAVPWSGVEVFAVACIFLLFPALFHNLLEATGFYEWYYGPHFMMDTSETAMLRRSLWAGTFVFPFQVAAILFVLRFPSGTRLYQLGLTCQRGATNVLLGVLTWIVVTPLAYLLLYAVVWVQLALSDLPVQKHAFERLAEQSPTVVERGLIVLIATITAAITEELVFRGVVQNWLCRLAMGGEIAGLVAVPLALIMTGGQLDRAWADPTPSNVLSALTPMLFVMILLPGLNGAGRLGQRWLGHPFAGRAIYGTSTLFVAGHSDAWPAPVPLVLLSVILGYLAFRTQSLVAPIVLHSLFNVVASVPILLR